MSKETSFLRKLSLSPLSSTETGKSPFLQMILTAPTDIKKKFYAFRTEMASTNEGSNLMLLDSAIYDLDKRQRAVEDSKFTWGMLKDGFPKE